MMVSIATLHLVLTLTASQALNPDLNAKKWDEGVDFYASGNEPFWSLNLDLDEAMRFEVLDGPSLDTPAVEGDRAQDADVIRYRAVTESGTLTVQITAAECADTMADATFSHRVRVDLKRPADPEEIHYEGCGRYVVDPRLDGAWTVQTIDGTAIDTSGLPNGTPTLELVVGDLAARGHTGCNNFNGSFHVEQDRISFGNAAMTMRACPGMKEEARFSRALSMRTYSFELRGSELALTHRDGKTLVFRKVE